MSSFTVREFEVMFEVRQVVNMLREPEGQEDKTKYGKKRMKAKSFMKCFSNISFDLILIIIYRINSEIQ